MKENRDRELTPAQPEPVQPEPAQPEEKDAQEEARPGNALTRLYDRLPFSYRHVDIAVKVLIGLIIILLVYGIIKGNR